MASARAREQPLPVPSRPGAHTGGARHPGLGVKTLGSLISVWNLTSSGDMIVRSSTSQPSSEKWVGMKIVNFQVNGLITYCGGWLHGVQNMLVVVVTITKRKEIH